jgi:hypothetical protein
VWTHRTAAARRVNRFPPLGEWAGSVPVSPGGVEVMPLPKVMSVKKKSLRKHSEKPGKATKVGDLISFGDIPPTVTDAKPTKDGGHLVSSSGELAAKERGYRIKEETLGFKIEHFPPAFVPRGIRRKAKDLGSADWDFSKLLKERIETKRMALFHELARESARIREACRAYEEAIKRTALAAPQAGQDDTEMLGAHDFADHSAEIFLRERLKGFPFSVRCIQTDAVADDIPWNRLNDEVKNEMIEAGAPSEKMRKKNSFHASLTIKDVPGEKPGWPLDRPIEFANEWDSDGRPHFAFNSGMPGLPELSRLGNGSSAGKLLTESVDLCVCYNFRDDDIIERLRAWLKARRKAFPEDLQEFKVSSERSSIKLKSDKVDAALKGLAALRLRAAMHSKAAAVAFHEIYFPNQKVRKPDIGNVQKQAEKALEWQRTFLRYCPLDSAPLIVRGPWDLECSLCFQITRVEEEPGQISKVPRERRCPDCDHREKVGWDGKKWLTYEE